MSFKTRIEAKYNSHISHLNVSDAAKFRPENYVDLGEIEPDRREFFVFKNKLDLWLHKAGHDAQITSWDQHQMTIIVSLGFLHGEITHDDHIKNVGKNLAQFFDILKKNNVFKTLLPVEHQDVPGLSGDEILVTVHGKGGKDDSFVPKSLTPRTPLWQRH